ncbi:hypothetical protein [Magnetospirillum molischianum]|uniref:Uncharacterized protein n=1 Tax=Magnetospirillum molischianum DSM 120 TaxID=1150626 RepID=H8FXX9_MAGML|nr:hypothetical protein [Magnetospirillum molischianum]CCG43217.1 exported hypothetical protein [Magnetospirillum molischianum DSM 120]
MLEITGWVALMAIALALSAIVAIAGFMNLPRYNIGGVENGAVTKLLTISAAGLVLLFWRWVISVAPFVITLK